jgi:beta-lactamase regulating signal transducer with metallopeptidase domain
MCHVRRRDNLTASIHMLVEAIFWFHPAVWWIKTRLLEEREQACDEIVLQSGNEGDVYAESILRSANSASSRRWPASRALPDRTSNAASSAS